jgi:hypothetical protein|tara:strand:+ start:1115 stop:1408 length:294 start_codon:yes stop_codon:yes gene_type:complete
MLVKLEDEKLYFYLCTSSDWSIVVLAENENEAASTAITKVLDYLDFQTNIAPAMRVKKINEKVENSDSLVRMDQILADMGFYKESKALKEIIENDRD